MKDPVSSQKLLLGSQGNHWAEKGRMVYPTSPEGWPGEENGVCYPGWDKENQSGKVYATMTLHRSHTSPLGSLEGNLTNIQ